MYKIIGTDQKQYGPISGDQLRQWLNEGRVNLETPVQSEGSNEWKPLGVLPEFASDHGSSHAPPLMAAATPPDPGGGLNVIIPYKNVCALVAYYCGVFSLIPLVGFVLGLVAFVLGILGLRFRRRNPAAGGAVHAWIGIVLGGLVVLAHVVVALILIYTARHKRH